MSYHIKTCQSYTSAMQDIAIASPNRYLIKVEDFFTTTAFLQNAVNLTEYPLLIVVRRGIEPLYRELPDIHDLPSDSNRPCTKPD